MGPLHPHAPVADQTPRRRQRTRDPRRALRRRRLPPESQPRHRGGDHPHPARPAAAGRDGPGGRRRSRGRPPPPRPRRRDRACPLVGLHRRARPPARRELDPRAGGLRGRPGGGRGAQDLAEPSLRQRVSRRDRPGRRLGAVGPPGRQRGVALLRRARAVDRLAHHAPGRRLPRRRTRGDLRRRGGQRAVPLGAAPARRREPPAQPAPALGRLAGRDRWRHPARPRARPARAAADRPGDRAHPRPARHPAARAARVHLPARRSAHRRRARAHHHAPHRPGRVGPGDGLVAGPRPGHPGACRRGGGLAAPAPGHGPRRGRPRHARARARRHAQRPGQPDPARPAAPHRRQPAAAQLPGVERRGGGAPGPPRRRPGRRGDRDHLRRTRPAVRAPRGDARADRRGPGRHGRRPPRADRRPEPGSAVPAPARGAGGGAPARCRPAPTHRAARRHGRAAGDGRGLPRPARGAPADE